MSRNFTACLLLALLTTTGCGGRQSLDKEASAARQQLLLLSEPLGAVGILDARESLSGDASRGSQRPLVVVGRIGGAKPVFNAKHASFFLVDPAATAEHDHHECGENCPYCAKGADDDAVAMIHCIDGRGQPVRVPADRLLGLAEGQTAVIRGRAQVDDSGALVVMADGIYIRR